MHRRLVSNFPSASIGRAVNHEAIKVHAFVDQGIVVATITDPRLDDFERQFLKNIGNKLYPQQQ